MSKKETSWKEWVWNEEARNIAGKIGSLERRKKKRTGIMRNLEWGNKEPWELEWDYMKPCVNGWDLVMKGQET